MEILNYLPEWTGKKILVVRLDRIGDLLITTPFIRALKTAIPSIQIDMLVSSLNAPVIQYNKDIHNIYTYNKKKCFSFLPKLWKMRHQKYDAIICVTSLSKTSNFIVNLIPSPMKIAFNNTFKNQEGIYTHYLVDRENNKNIMLHYKNLANCMGLEIRNVQPVLDIPTHIQDSINLRYPKDAESFRLVLFIGNIKKATNRWPTQKFIELIHKLRDEATKTPVPLEIFVMAGTSDTPLLKDFENVPNTDFKVYIGTDIYESAAFLKKANLYIGTSSGPTHIASAVQCPILSLVTQYVFEYWLPLGEKDSYIQASLYGESQEIGMTGIPVDAVYEKVLQEINRQ